MPRHGWVDNIKFDVEVIEWIVVDWIELGA
jgi:hypothetical protein